MDTVLTWSSAFFARNFMDVIQALIFSLVTVMLFFRTDARPRQLAKFALSFLVSFNTATIISTLVYQAVCANVELAGTLWDFLLATACLLVPMLPMIYLYKRVIGSQASVAAFIYALAPVPQEHVRFFDDELEHNERIRLHVLASLDKAIEKDWLRIYYQPIVEVSTRKLTEYEALSRWVDPEFGFLAPDQFVVPLETALMTCKLDLNILRLFGRNVRHLREEGRAVFPISFNISRTDLESGIDLFGAIEETMRQAELPRELVRVEITESALNGSSTAMADAVRRFHELELEVWMDDFGSGYSSLNVLKDYDFDVIKIDMQVHEHVRRALPLDCALGVRDGTLARNPHRRRGRRDERAARVSRAHRLHLCAGIPVQQAPPRRRGVQEDGELQVECAPAPRVPRYGPRGTDSAMKRAEGDGFGPRSVPLAASRGGRGPWTP